MIALPQRLPYVVWRNERLLPLSETWLAESIRLGAIAAGYGQWDLAPHVSRAIASYLEEEFNSSTISIPELDAMLRQSVEKIGYGDVAKVTGLAAPRLSISLAEIADRASYELMFYPMLREKLDDAVAIEARGLILGELRSCVKLLDHASHWRRTCEMLRGQIVHYIRDYLGTGRSLSLDFSIV